MLTQNTRMIDRLRNSWPFWVIGLALAYDFYSFTLQVSPGVISPVVMRDLGLSAFQISITTGLYFLAYGMMQLPAGLLLDRYGPRRLMTLGLMICAVGATLFAVSKIFALVALSQVIMGFGASFAYISVLFLALAWFPLRYFGLLVGATELCGSLGAVFAETPLQSAIENFGWRYAVFALALIGLVLAFLINLIVRDRNTSVALAVKPPRQDLKTTLGELRQLLSNPQIWIIGMCALLLWAPAVAFGALWGVQYLVSSFNMESTTAASICMFIWIGTATGGPFISWWANSTPARHIPMTVYGMIGLFATLILLFYPNPSYVVLAMAMFLFGFAASGTCSSFPLLQEFIPESLVGSALGFTNMLIVIGGPICQLLVGFLLDMLWSGKLSHGARVYTSHDFHLALLVLPICFALATLLSAFGIHRRRKVAAAAI